MMKTPSKAVILGCGSSGGVPSLGIDGAYWGSCDSQNPKNTRMRASFYVEYASGQKILIDTSPDLRQQYIGNQLKDLTAVVYSHDHADHTHGIDELRSLFFARELTIIPIYADSQTLKSLQNRFSYLFQPKLQIYPVVLEAKEFKAGIFNVDGIDMEAIEQGHGDNQKSFGFRFGRIAYSTDFNHLDDQALESYQDLDLWVVDCLSYDPKKTHNHLDLTLHWINQVRPKKAILTHMNATLDYEQLRRQLPDHIEPAYDGLTFHF